MKKIFSDLKTLRWQNFIFLFIAGCINGFGVNIFLAPVKLYDSGISGTSILLSQITPEYMSLSLFLLILNVPLFLFGLKKQGVFSAKNTEIFRLIIEIELLYCNPNPSDI